MSVVAFISLGHMNVSFTVLNVRPRDANTLQIMNCQGPLLYNQITVA